MIKDIFDEIASEPGTNLKMAILGKYKDNDLLKQVLYLANSRRVKFYIKQIPTYLSSLEAPAGHTIVSLERGLKGLDVLSKRVVTGHDAIEHLKEILQDLHPDDSYIIERIIEKDCKIGMGTTNINKIFPKLIEDTPYMGAKAFSKELVIKLLASGPAYSQMKMDGRYANAIIRNGDVELESRQGETTHLQGATFLKELSQLEDGVMNGELTMDGISRYESNGVIASLVSMLGKEKNGEDITTEIAKFEKENGITHTEALQKIRYSVWDRISVDEYFQAKSDVYYAKRLVELGRTLLHSPHTKISIIEMVQCQTYQEAMDHFQSLINKGHEGTILKSITGKWKDSKPTWQIKLKLEIDMDLKITGFNYGTGKNINVISSVDVESEDGLLKTSPTGIKESVMQWITDNQAMLLGKILTIKCSGVSQDSLGNYSVLHPVYKEVRDDKVVADTLPIILDIEAAAKGLK